MDSSLGFREEFHDVLERDMSTCDGADACRQAVRRQIGRGVDVIKMATTGGVNSLIGAGLGAQMFDDEAKAIVETAHLYGKKVAVHAHGADGINLALRAGADSIEHGTLLDEESLKLFKSTGAYYVPTLSTINGYLERIAANPNAYAPEVRKKIDWRIGVTGEALKKAVPGGVKIAFGTDAGVSKHGRNADEFELMVKFGMTPTTAIQAATVNAADLLGIADRDRFTRARQERRSHRRSRRSPERCYRSKESRLRHERRKSSQARAVVSQLPRKLLACAARSCISRGHESIACFLHSPARGNDDCWAARLRRR